jgi:hypothetical protein
MLFQPVGDGRFLRAVEADGFRGLVAAVIDEPSYESSDPETRLVHRLRLADDLILLGAADGRVLAVGDQDDPNVINVASDEPFVRSLVRIGFASLPPEPTLDCEPGASMTSWQSRLPAANGCKPPRHQARSEK